MNKKIGVTFSFLLLLVAVFVLVNPSLKRNPAVMVKYEGVLPGADCAGLKTELTLFTNNTYALKETYLATRDGDKTYNSSGKWRKITVGKRNIIQLNYEKTQEAYNFLIVDENRICVVDKELKDISCPMNLSLKRKK